MEISQKGGTGVAGAFSTEEVGTSAHLWGNGFFRANGPTYTSMGIAPCKMQQRIRRPEGPI